MSGIAAARRAARWSIVGSVLALVLAVPAWAQTDVAQPLARYIPAEGLAALVEHAGFDAHPEAWKGTARERSISFGSRGDPCCSRKCLPLKMIPASRLVVRT